MLSTCCLLNPFLRRPPGIVFFLFDLLNVEETFGCLLLQSGLGVRFRLTIADASLRRGLKSFLCCDGLRWQTYAIGT